MIKETYNTATRNLVHVVCSDCRTESLGKNGLHCYKCPRGIMRVKVSAGVARPDRLDGANASELARRSNKARRS